MATFQPPVVGAIYTTTEVELNLAIPGGIAPTYLAEVEGSECVIRTNHLEIEEVLSTEDFRNQKWECVMRHGVPMFKSAGKISA